MGIKDNPIVFLTKKTWEFSKGNRPKVVLYLVLFVFAQSLDALFPLIVAKVLNIIQLEGITQGTIYPIFFYLSLFIFITIGFWCFHGPARVIENSNAFLVRANYKKYLLEGTMVLPAEWHASHHSGDTIDKIEKATRALYDYSTQTYDVVEIIVRFTTAYIILAYFNFYSAFIVLFMVLLTGVVITRFDKVLVPQYKELNKAENKISEKIFDTLSNIMTVIILRVERLVSKSILNRLLKPYELYVRNQKINETKWFVVSMCTVVMTFLVLGSYLYSSYLLGTTILIGTVYVLYGYVERINDLFFHMAWKYGEIVKRRVAVANVEEISKEFAKKKRAKTVRLNGWRELKIKNLNFSYHTEEGTDLHLDNINITIKRNERIALIGHSGSGKTTFMKIIRDLYHPRLGDIYLNDKLLRYGFKSISNHIALIPQDPEIFSTTIKENITLGVGRKLEEIKKFTDMARFSDVIERLPKKLNSNIFEKGVNLSGGEKQRLALARGLMASQDKEILLLDEPTSSVDMRNEYLICQNMFREFNSKTIISSIHRLHLLPLFDKIYFFKKGRIVVAGTFEELLAGSGEFKRLWKKYVKSVK